jgi:hypothetical protein
MGGILCHPVFLFLSLVPILSRFSPLEMHISVTSALLQALE